MKHLFEGEYFSKYLENQKKIIQTKFENFNENEIEHLENEKIIERNLPEYLIREISIDFDSRMPSLKMIALSKDKFPMEVQISMHDGEKLECAKVTYTYNIIGEESFFYLKPDRYYSQIGIPSSISNKKLQIIIQTFHGSETLTEKIKVDMKGLVMRFQDEVKLNLESINKQIKEHNEELPNFMRNLLEEKERKIKLRKNIENDLNNF